MSTPTTASALEIGRRLGQASGRTDASRDADVQALVGELIGSSASTPEDALALTVWAFSLLTEIRAMLPDGTPAATDLRFVFDVATALVGRSVGALEAVTGIPSMALAGGDRFRQ